MNKENEFYKGIMVGFAVGTIVWCLLWSSIAGRIDRVHKQELDYIIEKHQKINYKSENNNKMATFETVEVGTIALIQQTEEGRIVQIGLTPSQSNMLQFFLAELSKESKLIQMPEEYDLVLKSSLKKKR